MKFNTNVSLMRAFFVKAEDGDEAVEMVKDNILTSNDENVHILDARWNIELNEFGTEVIAGDGGMFYVNLDLELELLIMADNEDDAQAIIDEKDWLENLNPTMIVLDEDFEGFWLEQDELIPLTMMAE